MVHFGKLNIEGFGSIYRPFSFDLDQPGLNVIRGKVGAGKTGIPSALTWCLFGTTLKEKSQVSTWEELRDEEYRGTKVETVFTKDSQEYRVVRCLGYKGKINIGGKKLQGGNNLFIFINGELYSKARNKADKQATINKVIGYSYELFKNSVIFGQKMKKIIEETGPNKKKIFEEAFEVGFIEEAKQNTKEKLDKYQGAMGDMETEIETTETLIEDNQEFYKDAKEEEKTFEKRRKENIAELREDITELEEEKESINNRSQAIEGDTTKLDKKIKKQETLIDKAEKQETEIEKLGGDLDDYELVIEKLEAKLNAKEKLCDTCGQPLNKAGIEKVKKKTQGDLKIAKVKVREIKLSITLLKEKEYDTPGAVTKLTKLRKKKKEIEVGVAQNKEREKRLPIINSKIEKLEEKITTLEKEQLKIKSTKYKKKIKKLEASLDKLKNDKKELEKEIETLKWLVSDPLSNNGLKAYMFNSLLQKVNTALEKYSRTLGFQVEFGIDLDTHRKDFYQMIYHEGMVKPYEDLSGGQKQLVDTSIAFAIHDAVSEIRPTNLMFMDEPFESLGVDEIETIEELVENKAKTRSLFLITHHTSFTPINVNEIMVTRNKKGFSTYK